LTLDTVSERSAEGAQSKDAHSKHNNTGKCHPVGIRILHNKHMRRIYDWNAIQQYHDKGNGFVACRRRFGVTHTAWNKAIKREELRTAPRPFRDRWRRYDWDAVQAYYDEGHSVRSCMRRFGFCVASWDKARERGEIR
jgi:hypothetical protein